MGKEGRVIYDLCVCLLSSQLEEWLEAYRVDHISGGDIEEADSNSK